MIGFGISGFGISGFGGGGVIGFLAKVGSGGIGSGAGGFSRGSGGLGFATTAVGGWAGVAWGMVGLAICFFDFAWVQLLAFRILHKPFSVLRNAVSTAFCAKA